MQQYFEKIKTAVDDGRLVITTFCNQRRSISNALAISASNGANVSGVIVRPFVDEPKGFEEGLRHIYEYAKDLGVEKASHEHPVYIIVKDEAGRIGTLEEWEQYLKINKHILFIVRDPHLQMQSLVERLANDLKFGIGSKLVTSAEAMEEHGESVDRFMREGGQAGPLFSQGDYDLSSWQSISEYMEALDRAKAQGQKIDSAVILGDFVRLDAKPFVQKVAKFAELGMNEKMLNWDAVTEENNRVRLIEIPEDNGLRQNAWIKTALRSGEFSPPDRIPLTLKKFPPHMASFIEKVAIPNFIGFFHRPDMICPDNSAQVLKLINSDIKEDMKYSDVDPTCAYAILAGLAQQNPKDAARFYKPKMDEIRAKSPAYEQSFAAMDRAAVRTINRGHVGRA